jgi:hypothetical protein
VARDYPVARQRASNLPTLRALFSLNAQQPSAAVELLQAPARFDFAVPGIAFNGFFGALYPVYIRGIAYLASRQPVEGATEFQKILDHRGIVLEDPVDAMARLQLASALASWGSVVRVKAAYEDFLDLWKSADQQLYARASQGGVRQAPAARPNQVRSGPHIEAEQRHRNGRHLSQERSRRSAWRRAARTKANDDSVVRARRKGINDRRNVECDFAIDDRWFP